MLFARPSQAAHTVLDQAVDRSSLSDDAIWLDLLDPTDAEREQATRICGFSIPSEAKLDEIESTSRVYREGEILYLSVPLARRRRHDECVSSPVGLIVGPKRLLTVRFLEYPAFDAFSHAVETGSVHLTAHELLLGLLEAIVDRVADVLEIMGAELERTASDIFRSGAAKGRTEISNTLREKLTKLGTSANVMSMIRDTLLGLTRVVVFLDDASRNADPASAGRVKNLGRDVRSLVEFDEHMTTKVQFLLDATLGFINIDQNNGIRILTVVSLIGIPPTLIASIYGMNFKSIPELNWSFGYYYALALMTSSIVVPLLWFKWRRWI